MIVDKKLMANSRDYPHMVSEILHTARKQSITDRGDIAQQIRRLGTSNTKLKNMVYALPAFGVSALTSLVSIIGMKTTSDPLIGQLYWCATAGGILGTLGSASYFVYSAATLSSWTEKYRDARNYLQDRNL